MLLPAAALACLDDLATFAAGLRNLRTRFPNPTIVDSIRMGWLDSSPMKESTGFNTSMLNRLQLHVAVHKSDSKGLKRTQSVPSGVTNRGDERSLN